MNKPKRTAYQTSELRPGICYYFELNTPLIGLLTVFKWVGMLEIQALIEPSHIHTYVDVVSARENSDRLVHRDSAG